MSQSFDLRINPPPAPDRGLGRCCLINPPHFIKEGNIWNQIRSTMPPLGLLYLAGVLEQAGIAVDVIDFQAEFDSWQALETTLACSRYDFYGITGTTPAINNAYRIAAIIKKHHPQAGVILGGVHVTALPEEALARDGVDWVVRGEGEMALLNLVTGAPAATILGLSYRHGDRIVHNQPDGLVENLDTIPPPAFHKLDLTRYQPAAGAYKRLPAINMTTTRGCPARCTFCNSANIRLRRRSAEKIFAEMAMLVHTFHVREIQFYDDTFTVFPSNIKKLCRMIIDQGLDVTWSCFARADYVNPELLHIMKQAGCHQIMYGIESADEKILANIQKNCSREKSIQAIAMTRAAGIDSRCTFMLGNPGETVATIRATIRLAQELNPDIAVFNITMPFPGTHMFRWAKEQGYLRCEDWDSYDLGTPILMLPTISADEIISMYRLAYRSFYLRPRFILSRLRRIQSLDDFKVLLRGAIGLAGFVRKTLSWKHDHEPDR
ncbi:MAG: cobalamin-dependent protein [Magnetococcales bacterium]|nr:cobalamin-dependent protein [Magnetococcales bacterium]